MPCLVALVAVLAPRVVSVVLWLFTTFFVKAYANNPLLMILGIVFLPFTTLAYAWMVNTEGGVRGTFSIVVMVIAVLADLSAFEGGRRSRR
ncbi:MAG TPA: hypothetical protein VND21_11865 [Planctomycetota bacterium]|nr:hypothetical protein [Planctomycetota bacterium]